MFSIDLTLGGSIFQTVGATKAKTLVAILVWTLGTKTKSELDDAFLTRHVKRPNTAVVQSNYG